MSWTISEKQYIPATIGEPFGGGYFAGYISHTADGNPTHALIVSPKATGNNRVVQWKTTNTSTPGTNSNFDGYANTQAMVTAGIDNHPAAKFCVNLNIGGYTDWYLPARFELDIAYFNLKPTTGGNATSWGTNIYAVPQRNSNYSSTYPTRTFVSAFSSSGSEAFTDPAGLIFRSSTEFSATHAWVFSFSGGGSQNNGGTGNQAGNALKTSTSAFGMVWSARAFRRIPLTGFTT